MKIDASSLMVRSSEDGSSIVLITSHAPKVVCLKVKYGDMRDTFGWRDVSQATWRVWVQREENKEVFARIGEKLYESGSYTDPAAGLCVIEIPRKELEVGKDQFFGTCRCCI